MQTHITPNNKLASYGTIGLLLLAGIAGMVFLLPAVHAASPTVTLSTISPLSSVAGGPTELTGVTSGTVGSSLTLTGMGFASNAPISVSTTSGTNTVFWFLNQGNCGSAFSSNSGGNNGVDSLLASGTSPLCLTTTASGEFKSVFTVPALPGGAETIVVSDGTNTVSVPFTITPKVSFSSSSANNYGFPEVNIATGTFTITGFGASESVTVATTAFTAASFTTTSCTTSAFGSCSFTDSPLVVADTTSGSKSITATGGTSALTASTTYTIKPWAAFYNSAGGATTFSFIGTAPTSLLIELHGMTAQTVAANSITVGGVATSHAAFTIGSSGAVGGVGAQIVVSPTANVPFGNVAVVVAGVTFNYATGNIAQGFSAAGGAPTSSFHPWGGALISSIQGTGSSTGVVQIDQSNYKPALPASGVSKTNPAPPQNQIGFFAYGFVVSSTAGVSTCAGTGGAVTMTAGGESYTTAPTFQVGNCETGGVSPGYYTDSNGAFFVKGPLADTPWSTTAAPTTVASYTPTFTQAAIGPANILNPSFGITPWIDTTKSTVISSTVDYSTITSVGFTAHGFSNTEGVTFTVGGSSVIPSTAGTCTSTSGGLVSACGAGTAKMPDLAAGSQNLVATGGLSGIVVTSTGAIVYEPRIDNQPSTTATQALSSVAGGAGSTTILRTGTNFGPHGLYANTAYQVVWNEESNTPGTAGKVLASFTSTATGGIPVPGVQFAVPADTSGIHIISLERTSTPGTSFIFSDTLLAVYSDSDTALGAVFQTNYGDMLFNLGTSLIATPTVANVGGTVTISGTGLQASTLYDLSINMAAGSPPSACTTPGSTISGQFTTTSSGTVPTGVSLAITDMPTAPGLEQGTLYCIFAQTPANFGPLGSIAGTSQFLLEASANLNATSGPIGHNFIETAHGLNANTGYNILFAPYACGSSGSICGTVVGAILSNAQGAGSATFTIPAAVQSSTGSSPTNPGSSYTIQLQKTGTTGTALAIPPTFTVTSGSPTSCNTTTCMTANGSPSQTTVGSNKAVQTSYTNNSNAPLTAIVYAVVHNAAGQTVSYSTATLQLASGASGTAYDVLFGLAPGTYSVSVFVTTTSGVAISSTSTVTVTV